MLDVVDIIPYRLLEALVLERVRVADVDVLDLPVAEDIVQLLEGLSKETRCKRRTADSGLKIVHSPCRPSLYSPKRRARGQRGCKGHLGLRLTREEEVDQDGVDDAHGDEERVVLPGLRKVARVGQRARSLKDSRKGSVRQRPGRLARPGRMNTSSADNRRLRRFFQYRDTNLRENNVDRPVGHRRGRAAHRLRTGERRDQRFEVDARS
jgi:hypothetical protein